MRNKLKSIFRKRAKSSGSFSLAWEQRKVNDLVVERNQQSPKSKEYPLMAFVANEGVAAKGDRFNREFLVLDEHNKKYKKTEYGDFIYSSNNLETGSIGLNHYGKATISPVYSIFEPTAISDSEFLGKLFTRKNFINEMVRWRQGVIYGQWKIHESDFIKIDTIVPSLYEQQKIGSLFKDLDNLITLHQRKYIFVDKNLQMKLTKKTITWEQRKFIDLLDFERPDNYMVSDDHYENDGVPVLTANKAFVLGYKNESGAYNKGNCVIFDDFTLDSKFVDFPFKINSSAIKILTAKHNNNLKFIYYLLSSSNILMQGHARHYISIVQPFVTSIPETQEQNKIECMISDLDNLITLHQRE